MTMEGAIQNTICLFDSLLVVGYASMTAMVYLSAVVPSLKDLASHGKTREGNGSKLVAASKAGPFDFVNGEFFLVPKKAFRQFYVWGLLVLSAATLLATKMRSSATTASPPPPSLKVASTALLYLHLCRRLYECTFVHKWRATSQMHLAGYLVGAIHYVWLPMVFIRLPCEECVRNIVGDPLPNIFYEQYKGPLWLDNVEVPPLVWRLPPILLCLWGQYQQYRHHVLLAYLRKPETSQYKDKPTTNYSLPNDGWFVYVTCPHYLAEMLVYISFAILLAQEQVQGVRHYVVLFWVVSNLTLSALINYKWYKQNLPPEEMKGRKAIFPFLL